MGKAGNKARRQAKREREQGKVAGFSPLDANIQAVLAEDEQLLMPYPQPAVTVDIDTATEEYQSSLEKVYGKPGVPQHDNVIFLGAPKPEPKKVVDILGRVVDAPLPQDLKASVMAMRSSQPSITEPDPVSELDKRRVTVCRDHMLEYPDLYMEVFVSPDPTVRDDEARFAQMFARSRCTRAKSVLEADLVIFGGGSDVDPALYGEEPHTMTHFDKKRDDDDMNLYLMCLEEGIPMMGICRGAQFLHVMNGGKLYQHVDNHVGDHKIWCIREHQWIDKVSSVHHQMCRSNLDGGMEILATSGEARHRWCNRKETKHGQKTDVEAFFYKDTCSIGVQGHPEYAGYPFFTKWCLNLVNELVLCNPDIEWRDKNRRVKLELLEERKLVGIKPPTRPKKETK